MATNGSSTTNQPIEKIHAAAVAATAPDGPAHDFLARVEDAAQLLTNVAQELGQVGEQDMRENMQFAERLRDDMRRHVTTLLARKRRELFDLERILGKISQ